MELAAIGMQQRGFGALRASEEVVIRWISVGTKAAAGGCGWMSA